MGSFICLLVFCLFSCLLVSVAVSEFLRHILNPSFIAILFYCVEDLRIPQRNDNNTNSSEFEHPYLLFFKNVSGERQTVRSGGTPRSRRCDHGTSHLPSFQSTARPRPVHHHCGRTSGRTHLLHLISQKSHPRFEKGFGPAASL